MDDSQHSAHDDGGSGGRTREFVRLLSECDRRLYAYVLALVVDLDDADDILQSTKLKLWEQFDRFEPGTDFGAWAATVAHYEVLAYRRRAHAKHEHLGQAFIEAASEAITKAIDQQDRRRSAFARCLAKLDESRRAFVIRCYTPGVRIKDVAKEINRSVAGTYQRLWRVRDTLHKCVKEELQREERE